MPLLICHKKSRFEYITKAKICLFEFVLFSVHHPPLKRVSMVVFYLREKPTTSSQRTERFKSIDLRIFVPLI